jgi:hypothetical protein
MKSPSPSTSTGTTFRKPEKPRKKSDHPTAALEPTVPLSRRTPFPQGYEIRAICLYPTVEAGKLARAWLESAFHHVIPKRSNSIEYFNYAVLSRDGISWHHVIGRIRPDIILMISDGKNQLLSGFRHSLKELLHESSSGKKPLVIFRDLEPTPSINTSVLLDYVAALSDHNHCEFNAMDGNGTPINCFRHQRLLLRSRHYHE